MADVMDAVVLHRVPTGIEGAEAQDDFIITNKAVDMINQVKEQNEVPAEYNLRLGTRSGGCSGMNYMLGFDSEVNDNDKLIESSGLKFVVDSHSLFYLQGVTLDFTEGPQGSGFVFNNPNNDHACGCQH